MRRGMRREGRIIGRGSAPRVRPAYESDWYPEPASESDWPGWGIARPGWSMARAGWGMTRACCMQGIV